MTPPVRLASESNSLNVPRSADAALAAASFGLVAHWRAPQPTLADLADVASPVNLLDTAPFLVDRWNASSPSMSNTAFVVDPFTTTSGSEELVLQVDYPRGTRDGTQFFMTPMRPDAHVRTAVLQYDVAFDPEFDFVKGGKLPGVYGSKLGAESVCSGGNRLASCFSARLMWRQRGEGEVYAYIPTYDGFCRQSDVDCNAVYGISLSRGSFDFSAGGWTTITQLVALNTPGYANGLLYLWANGSLALAHTGLVWRTQESVTLSKIMFSTFFGGGDPSWDSKGGSSYFRNFQVYAGTLPSNTSGPAVNASLTATSAAPLARTHPLGFAEVVVFVLLLSLLSFSP
ncbi:hypothetical protein JCM10212_006748 [Sporobolomyces blumeae]